MTTDLKFAIDLAKIAGDRALKRIERVKVVGRKDARDIALNLDIETGEFINQKIKRRFPDHNIVNEDARSINRRSEHYWLIDPIDGSKYLQNKIKFFSVSISLWRQNEPLLGVVYNPGTKELWSAETGRGAFLNNKAIKVSARKNIGRCIIALDGLIYKNQKIMNKISREFYRVRMLGCGSLALCYLAQGYFDAFLNASSEKFIDISAGLLIAQEAGAKITDHSGKKIVLFARNILVTNKKIHPQLLKLIK